MLSQLFNRQPMNFAPTGQITPVDASAYITPQQRAEMAKSGGGPAAGGVPGQGGGAPMAGGAPMGGGDSANIQSIMQGLGIGGDAAGSSAALAGGGASGGLMASIAKILPFLAGG